MRRTAFLTTAATITFAALAVAQESGTGATADLADANAAIEAATMAGLVETLASGGAYTAFVPSNDALAAVQEAATELMGDQAQLATVIQGYVIEGNVMAADAMTLVADGGGTVTVESLAGTPLTLATEGESLTVNGAAVTRPDITLGNVTIHVIDAAFLPGEEAAAD